MIGKIALFADEVLCTNNIYNECLFRHYPKPQLYCLIPATEFNQKLLQIYWTYITLKLFNIINSGT